MWLQWELRNTELRPIVLGGLVPDILAGGEEPNLPAHQGTTDVDLHVTVELPGDTGSLSALESALRRARFQPLPKAIGGWQWYAQVEGTVVRVDLLCDHPEVQAEHVIPITDSLGVLNLRGTGYVLEGFIVRTLSGVLPDGSDVTVDVRFAGLGGYVLTKCVSAITRQKQKDFYDLAYVVLYNQHGGPDAATAAIKSSRLSRHIPALRTVLRELSERYRDSKSIGPQSFASLCELAAPGGDPAQLAEDAVSGIRNFISSLLEDS